MFVYDKNRNREYLSTPKNESHSRFFYDVNTEVLSMFSNYEGLKVEVVDEKIRTLSEEKTSLFFRRVYNDLSKNLVEDGYDFLQEDREHFYNFILLQFLRTPYYRKRLRYFIVSFAIRMQVFELDESEYLHLIHNILLFGLIEKLYGLDFKLNKDFHNFFDHLISELLALREQIEKSGVLFLVNRTTHSFITSSSPVKIKLKNSPGGGLRVFVALVDKNKPAFDIGCLPEIASVYIPIDPDLSVFLYNKDLEEVLQFGGGGIGFIDEYNSDLLMNLNYAMFLNGTDKIYSSTNCFSQYIEMEKNRINPLYNFNFSGNKNTLDNIEYL